MLNIRRKYRNKNVKDCKTGKAQFTPKKQILVLWQFCALNSRLALMGINQKKMQGFQVFQAISYQNQKRIKFSFVECS